MPKGYKECLQPKHRRRRETRLERPLERSLDSNSDDDSDLEDDPHTITSGANIIVCLVICQYVRGRVGNVPPSVKLGEVTYSGGISGKHQCTLCQLYHISIQ
ncbi:uncharacterized protein LOC119170634 isoform X3 [Rhipicephalus microplus]